MEFLSSEPGRNATMEDQKAGPLQETQDEAQNDGKHSRRKKESLKQKKLPKNTLAEKKETNKFAKMKSRKVQPFVVNALPQE